VHVNVTDHPIAHLDAAFPDDHAPRYLPRDRA
jgi:hypothetical protein